MKRIKVEELRKELEGLDGELEVSVERIGKWSEKALVLSKDKKRKLTLIMIETRDRHDGQEVDKRVVSPL